MKNPGILRKLRMTEWALCRASLRGANKYRRVLSIIRNIMHHFTPSADSPKRVAVAKTLLALFALGLMLTVDVPSSLAQSLGAPFDNSRLEHLRGLAFKKPVPVVAMQPEQFQQVFESNLMRDFSDERLRADGIAGSMVGLFPLQFDLKTQILNQAYRLFCSEYSDHLKEIVLIAHGWDEQEPTGMINMSSVAFRSGFLGNQLAYMLTIALQDQHYDLERRYENLKDEPDQLTAFDSVVAGDATLASVAYADGDLDSSMVNRLVSNLDGMNRLRNTWASDIGVPEGLSAPFSFAHTEGIKFVAEALRRGGWPAVDALYNHPPVSTQQIINPQLYFDQYRSPVNIQLAGYQKILPSATVIHTDTYGELLLRVILRRNLGESSTESDALAQQWAGDRMAILQQGDSTTVLWMLAFSDSSSATRFAAIYAPLLDRLHGGTKAHRVDYRGWR